MAATIPEITERNQPLPRPDVTMMTDRQLLEEVALRIRDVERMYLAWQIGGLRGLRQARRG